MEKVYYVRFHYDGIEPKRFAKTLVESEFAYAYSKYCEYTNPLIPKWNEEYDKLGLPNDWVDEDGTINLDSKYNRYMAEKFTEYTDKLTKDLKHIFVKKYMIGIECDFQAELIDGTIMSFYVVEG